MTSLYSRVALGLLTLLIAAPLATVAEPLGRLFFSPEQRSALDKQVQTAPEDSQGTAIRFDGMVLRSNGRSTYWLGGIPRSSAEGIPARLKVGEAVDPSTGDKRPVLGDGALRIHKHQGR